MSVISATDVEKANGVLVIASKDIVTPLAADRARDLGVKIQRAAQTSAPFMRDRDPSATAKRTRAAGAVSEVTGPSALRAPAATQSGALYRRGASVPLAILPDRSTNAAAADAKPLAAVIGAGHVGAMTALRLAETSLFARIALVDIVPDLASGLALDMWHSSSLRGFTTQIEGSADLSAVTGADYVVVTAGKPRQPGMSRTDLTDVNAAIIRGVAEGIRRYAPSSVVIVVTNPLEEMTHLMAKTTGFPPQRVLGMAGVLDAARFKSLIALTGIAPPQDIAAIALGSHGPEMVIPLSQATVNGAPLQTLLPPNQINAIVERTRDSGAEVVKLLQTGSAYFAPAESAAAMVIGMVRESDRVLAACVQSGGAYGIEDTRVGLPVKLSRGGVKEIVAVPLNSEERAALAKAASSIAVRVRELG